MERVGQTFGIYTLSSELLFDYLNNSEHVSKTPKELLNAKKNKYYSNIAEIYISEESKEFRIVIDYPDKSHFRTSVTLEYPDQMSNVSKDLEGLAKKTNENFTIKYPDWRDSKHWKGTHEFSYVPSEKEAN